MPGTPARPSLLVNHRQSDDNLDGTVADVGCGRAEPVTVARGPVLAA